MRPGDKKKNKFVSVILSAIGKKTKQLLLEKYEIVTPWTAVNLICKNKPKIH